MRIASITVHRDVNSISVEALRMRIIKHSIPIVPKVVYAIWHMPIRKTAAWLC